MNEQEEAKIREEAEKEVKNKNRFQELSEQVIKGKIQEETLAKAKEEALKKAADAEKERDFYKDFSLNASKYPNASQYQDQIFAKVKNGYSIEDAMVSVLAKEGKLSSQPPEPARYNGQAEGGSAPTSFEGSKSLHEMTPSEKMSALAELDKTGELANALRGR